MDVWILTSSGDGGQELEAMAVDILLVGVDSRLSYARGPEAEADPHPPAHAP